MGARINMSSMKQTPGQQDGRIALDYYCANIRGKIGVVLKVKGLDPIDDEDDEDETTRPTNRVVFVLDTSHSMTEPHGQGNFVTKLDKIKMFARLLVHASSENDHISVVTFGTHAKVVFPLEKMTSEVKTKALQAIEDITASGVTNIGDGLFKAVDQFRNPLFRRKMMFNDCIALFTDGMANDGVSETETMIEQLRQRITAVREDSLYDKDYGIRICTCCTQNFMPELLFNINNSFSSNAVFLLRHDASIELNLMKQYLEFKNEVASKVSVAVTGLHGTTMEIDEMLSEHVFARDQDVKDMSNSKITYFLHDMKRGAAVHFWMPIKLPKKSKRTMKNKDVLQFDLKYSHRGTVTSETISVPFLSIPRKEDKNASEDNILMVAAQECRITAVRALHLAASYMKRLDRSSARDALHDGGNTVRDLTEYLGTKISEEGLEIMSGYVQPILSNFDECDRCVADLTVRWDDVWAMMKALASCLARERSSTCSAFLEGTDMFACLQMEERLEMLRVSLQDMYGSHGFPESAIGSYKSIYKKPVAASSGAHGSSAENLRGSLNDEKDPYATTRI